MTMNSKKLMPVFENGMAQPVFPFTDGKTGDAYDAKTSDIVRFCVYVEANFDTNGDGKGDLIKAFVQVPRSAAEGNYKAASVFEARPYCAGVNADGYDHMKEVEGNGCPGPDSMKINYSPAPGNPSKYISTMEAAEKANPADWHFPDHGNGDAMCYENIDAYNYYLVRGYAVVLSAGVGTLGSDGFEYTGSDCERDSFRCIVEWLHGDRIAYADRNREEAIRADWSNGKVAMTGRSYAGTMPFAVATTGVAGLETIVPVAGISDWYSFLNQQGAQRSMQADSQRLGMAIRKLAGNDTDRLKAVQRRFNAFATARSMPECLHHLRGLIQLLRSEDIPLDYVELAGDLYEFQTPDGAARVRLRWGQDFYRNAFRTEQGKDDDHA